MERDKKSKRMWNDEMLEKKHTDNVCRYIRISLQLECYADDTGDESVYDTPGFKTLDELRKNYDNYTNEELIEKAELVIKQFNETIDKLGRDKFITYEDGDVEYIWKNHIKEKK